MTRGARGIRSLAFHSLWLAASVLALSAFLSCSRLTRAPITPTPAPAPASHDATVRHSFADVPHWSAVFDDPSRDAWQKPVEVVHALGIHHSMCVADLGAGTGYFSRHLSAAVGATGTVLAADTEPNLVVHLRERAEKELTPNVVPILASADNPRLPAGAVDLILIVDTVHHLDDRPNYFRRLRRFLKPGGRVVIIDFKKEELPVGPPVAHKLAPDAVAEELRAAGYQLVAALDLLPYQYFLIFQPR